MTAKYTCIAKWMGFIACLALGIFPIISYSVYNSSIPLRAALIIWPAALITLAGSLYLVFFSDRLFQRFSMKFDLRWIILPVFAIPFLMFSHSYYEYIIALFISALILFRGNTIVKTILLVLIVAGSGYWLISTLQLDATYILAIEKIGLIWTLVFVILSAILYFLRMFAPGKLSADTELDPVPIRSSGMFQARKSVFLTLAKWISAVLVLIMIPSNMGIDYIDFQKILVSIVFALPTLFVLFLALFSEGFMAKKYAGEFDIRWGIALICILPMLAINILTAENFVAEPTSITVLLLPLSLLLCCSISFKINRVVDSVLVVLFLLSLYADAVTILRIHFQLSKYGLPAMVAVLILTIVSVVFYFIGSARAAKALHESAPEAEPETAPEQ